MAAVVAAGRGRLARFRRYRQIMDVLAKYGFGILLDDLVPGSNRLHSLLKGPEQKRPVYERIRLAIEELGPTFVKFGQIMGTRPDLLPPPLIEELKTLQDQASPLPFPVIMGVIEASFPGWKETFREIDEVPVASASLAQVHRAVLADGTVVALKVRRPGIVQAIETDIAILQSLAARLESSFPDSRIYNPSGMVQDFSSQVRKELDFARDGKNALFFSRNFRGVAGIRFPEVYPGLSSESLLVMEFVEGTRIDDIASITARGIDPRAIGERGFYAYMKMIFEDGFFHGDPHPGNLLVDDTGTIIVLDFGVVGIIRPERRHQFLLLLFGIINHDVDLVLKSFEGLGVTIREEDREDIRDDLYAILLDADQFIIGKNAFSGVIASLTEILRRYQIQVPAGLMLLLKVLVMVYGLGEQLDPGFDFTARSRQYLGNLRARDLVGPQVHRATHTLMEAADALFNLPRYVNQSLKQFASGTMRLEIKTDLASLQHSLERASDKILVGLITAALVIGSSLVLVSSKIAVPQQVVYLAIFGYTGAMVIGFVALLQVFISRREE